MWFFSQNQDKKESYFLKNVVYIYIHYTVYIYIYTQLFRYFQYFQWFSHVLFFQAHLLPGFVCKKLAQHEQFRCEEVGVRGYPTIKYGDPDDLQDIQGVDGLKRVYSGDCISNFG